MARYEILYAEDIPHYCTASIKADSPKDAIRIAKRYDYGDAAADPDWSNPVCKRIVSIHDETGEAIAEGVPLDECFLRYGGEAERQLCDAASEMLAALRSALDWIETGRISGATRLATQVCDDIRRAIAKSEGRAEK